MAAACAIISLAAIEVSLLAYPESLYSYRAAEGRLRLYSDRAFDAERGRSVLADVERRLDAAPAALRDNGSVYRIFVTHAEWRKRLVFLWSYGAGGVNYYPIAGSVFLRQSDIEHDRVFRSDGQPVAPPRTLAYFAAHEIGHSLIGKRVGALANWRLPAWIREGMADYIAYRGAIDIAELTRALRAGERDLDPKRSGLYSRYVLLVAFMMQREGWPADRLLSSGLTQREAEQRLLAGVL